MSIWAGLLLLAVAGMIVLLVRRLPAAVSDVRGGAPSPPPPAAGPQPGEPLRWPQIDVWFKRLSQHWVATRSRPSRPVSPHLPAIDPLPKIEEPITDEILSEEKLPAAANQSIAKPVERPLLVTEGAAEAAYQEHQFAEAAVIYENLIRQQPQNEHLYARLGLVYLELERFHDARDVFRTDLKFGDQVAVRHFHLAMAEYGLGHRMTAVRYLKRAIALAPTNRKYHKLLETFESERG